MADLSEKDSASTIKITGTDSSGSETNYVDATVNGLKVDGSSVTQPISATSLPLPSGASTSALQTTGNTTLSSINTKINTTNNQIITQDAIRTSLTNGAISVSTATEAKVGGTRLTNRKTLVITPTDKTIYWGSSNTVTTITGTPIFKNQTLFIDIADVAVWLVSSSGTANVRIIEGS